MQLFPDLPDSDKPETILALHQSPDGTMYWIAGQEGMLLRVSYGCSNKGVVYATNYSGIEEGSTPCLHFKIFQLKIKSSPQTLKGCNRNGMSSFCTPRLP